MAEETPSIGLEAYWQAAQPLLERVRATQAETIRRAARLCADCIEQDGVVHTFGSGHSRGFAMELVHRAGGLAPINRLDFDDLALFAGWPLERVKSLECERDLEAGKALLSCHRIEQPDLFLIASQSGVNAAIVELALQIKGRGHRLIAVTSLEHSRRTPARHPGGKKLYELADLVIENLGPFGDTVLDIPNGRVCSTSSLSGALIAQMLNAEIVNALLADGKEPPVFLSDNIPGGIERNLLLQKRYEQRIRW